MGKLIRSANMAMTGEWAPYEDFDIPEGTIIDLSPEVKTLENTALLANKCKNSTEGHIGLKFSVEKEFQEEGLFVMNISWDNNQILQTGFTVDADKNLLIGHSQRHRLGNAFGRGDVWNQRLPEKAKGDEIIRNIESNTGINIELLGVFFSTMYLSDRLDEAIPDWSRKILLLNFDEIHSIKEFIESSHFDDPKSVTRRTYESKKRHMDHRLLLEQIGFQSFLPHSERFFAVPAEALRRKFENYFTDDQNHKNRYIYRKEIYNFINPTRT